MAMGYPPPQTSRKSKQQFTGNLNASGTVQASVTISATVIANTVIYNQGCIDVTGNGLTATAAMYQTTTTNVDVYTAGAAPGDNIAYRGSVLELY